MSNFIESITVLRSAAHDNFKAYAEKHNESFEDVLNYFTKQVDEYNLLVPLEFYRRLYNKSIEIMND